MYEALTFTEWSTMMVPTYPEDGSRALKVYQHQHHGCAGRAQSACRQRSEEQLSRDCVGRFGWDLHGKTARSALYLTVNVAGGGTSVHACAVFLRRKSRSVTFRAIPRTVLCCVTCVRIESCSSTAFMYAFANYIIIKVNIKSTCECKKWAVGTDPKTRTPSTDPRRPAMDSRRTDYRADRQQREVTAG